MSQLRKDPISGHWVIIAESRAGRPQELQLTTVSRSSARCPFCAGHEADTPPAIATYPRADRDPSADREGPPPAWQVRVVPNKYPAVEPQTAPAGECSGLYQWQSGRGVHEVIVESPQHLTSLTDLSDQQAHLALLAYRDRLEHLGRQDGLAYAQIFKNVGANAGASLEHVHSQLLATTMVPTHVQRKLKSASDFHHQHGQCLFCTLLAEEISSGQRVLAESPDFVAFCPYASRFPYQMCLMPRRHCSHFETCSDEQLQQLAGMLRNLIGRLESHFDQPAYNYMIHSAPFDSDLLDHYHWHMEIYPRLTRVAGFEWATDCYINPVPPEQAALQLSRRMVTSQDNCAEDIPTRKTS